MSNLPHRAFPKLPMVWGAPPSNAEDRASSIIAPPSGLAQAGGGVDIGNLSNSLTPSTFAHSYTTGVINTAFPKATRVATLAFPAPVGIISIDLVTAMNNQTTDGFMCYIVAKDIGPTIDVTAGSVIFASHLCGPASVMSQRSAICFADDVAQKLGSGEKLALYLASAGTGFASNTSAAVVTARFFNLT